MQRTFKRTNPFRKIFSFFIDAIIFVFLFGYFGFVHLWESSPELKNGASTFLTEDANSITTNDKTPKDTPSYYSEYKEELKKKPAYQEYIENQHPDPIIQEIEKRLNFKENLTADDIKHLELVRQKRIDYLMEEKKNKIINGYNQNNPAPPSQVNTYNNSQQVVPSSNSYSNNSQQRVNAGNYQDGYNQSNNNNTNRDSFISILK